MMCCRCDYSAVRNSLIAFSVIAAVMAGGAIASLVLMAQYRAADPSTLCNLAVGNCTDSIADSGYRSGSAVVPMVDVEITVSGCTTVNRLQMRANVGNCAGIDKLKHLRYDNAYYYPGAFSCHVAEPCVWDHGAFEVRDEALIAAGVVACVLWLFSFVVAMTLVGITCGGGANWGSRD